MGDFYGYNPAEYRNDFSWIGKIGDVVAQTAYKMPALIEHNKAVKESRVFKQNLSNDIDTMLNGLDDQMALNIALSMGASVQSSEQAKEFLRKRIPTLSDRETNEEARDKAYNTFVIPLVQAATSDAGGGKIDPQDLIRKISMLFGGIQSNEGFKDVASQAQRFGVRQEAQRLLEQNPEVGKEEMVSLLGKKFPKASYETLQTESMPQLGRIQRQANVAGAEAAAGEIDQSTAFSAALKSGADPSTAQTASGALGADLNRKLQEDRNELAKAKGELEKIKKDAELEDPTKLEKDAEFFRNKAAYYRKLMEGVEDKNNANRIRWEQYAKDAEKTAREFEVAASIAAQNPPKKGQGFGAVLSAAKPAVAKEREEVSYFDEYAEGDKGQFKGKTNWNPLNWSGADEERQFIDAYTKKFGVAPVSDGAGGWVPQFSADRPMDVSDTRQSANVPAGRTLQKGADTTASADTKSKYVVGQIYKDAKGKKARYLGVNPENPTDPKNWEEVS